MTAARPRRIDGGGAPKARVAFQFSAEDLTFFEAEFGEKLPVVLPSLRFGAQLFRAAKTSVGNAAIQKALKQLDRRLDGAQNALTTLPSDARFRLMPVCEPPEALEMLLQRAWAAMQLVRDQIRVARTTYYRWRPRPGMLLASAVAGACERGGLRVGISRGGAFARVLRQVWCAVEGTAPDDLFPYVKEAADIHRRQNPHSRPPIGRPRKKKLV